MCPESNVAAADIADPGQRNAAAITAQDLIS
ncbi:MAG: hypothetical protein JWQ90_1084 [Hydrocarboniphaga sp.]|nr:hypothetical protein [Hydrocarboniphaga sp.]